MLRVEEQKLLDFAARQHGHFVASDWFDAGLGNPEVVALVAKLLSGATWYGHQDSLLEIANRLDPDGWTLLHERIRRHDFDCSRFNNMVRHETLMDTNGH